MCLSRSILPHTGRMKLLNPCSSRRQKALTFLFAFCLTLFSRAEVRQAWIQKYANVANGTNQAVALALDPSGNVVSCGVSQNTNSNLDYVTLKYQPNGSR